MIELFSHFIQNSKFELSYLARSDKFLTYNVDIGFLCLDIFYFFSPNFASKSKKINASVIVFLHICYNF